MVGAERAKFLADKRLKMEERLKKLKNKNCNSIEEDLLPQNSALPTSQRAEAQNSKIARADIENLQTSFKKLYDMTGAKDVNELCQKLLTQDETQRSFSELRNYYISLIEGRKRERERLKE